MIEFLIGAMVFAVGSLFGAALIQMNVRKVELEHKKAFTKFENDWERLFSSEKIELRKNDDT